MKTPHVVEAVRRLVKLAREKHDKIPMTGARGAILDELERALDRNQDGAGLMTPEQSKTYLDKLEDVMAGAIGDMEWEIREALKEKSGE